MVPPRREHVQGLDEGVQADQERRSSGCSGKQTLATLWLRMPLDRFPL